MIIVNVLKLANVSLLWTSQIKTIFTAIVSNRNQKSQKQISEKQDKNLHGKPRLNLPLSSDSSQVFIRSHFFSPDLLWCEEQQADIMFKGLLFSHRALAWDPRICHSVLFKCLQFTVKQIHPSVRKRGFFLISACLLMVEWPLALQH